MEIEDTSGRPPPARYRISEQDYVRAMRLHARTSWPRIALLLAMLLGSAALAAFGPVELRPVAFGGMGAVALVWAGSYALLPWIARRHYRKYKAIQEELSIALEDEGVRFASANADGVLLWRHVLKWRQDETYVLIYPMPRLFHIVPKSIAAQGFDVSALTSRLRERIGAAS